MPRRCPADSASASSRGCTYPGLAFDQGDGQLAGQPARSRTSPSFPISASRPRSRGSGASLPMIAMLLRGGHASRAGTEPPPSGLRRAGGHRSPPGAPAGGIGEELVADPFAVAADVVHAAGDGECGQERTGRVGDVQGGAQAPDRAVAVPGPSRSPSRSTTPRWPAAANRLACRSATRAERMISGTAPIGVCSVAG